MSLRLLLACACLLGCSNGPSASADAGPLPGTVVDAGGYTLTVLAPTPAGRCDVHASSPAHFTDTTAQWGLSNVANGGYYTGDLDQDGYSDLVVVGGAADAGLPEGVLMNRPAPGGGRTFVDETQKSGLFQTRDGGAGTLRQADLISFADVNNDGALDVYSGVNFAAGTPTIPDRNEVLLNDGHGHFAFAPQSDPSTITESSGYQGVFTDVNDDGSPDLLLTYWYENTSVSAIGSQAQLFLGNGDGTFSSVTQSAGLMMDNTGNDQSVLAGTDSRPSFGAVACDVDGDGYPELLVSSYGGQSNVLWHNDGTGHFARVTQHGGYDGDLIVDYHDNQYYACYCTAHATDTYCGGAPKPLIMCPQPVESYWSPGYSDSPALANGNNFSAACRDIDGDGKPDLFQGTIRHWWAGNATDPSQILLNQTAGGAIGFLRVDDAQSGIVFPHIDPQGWNEGIQQAALVDMNNDGRTDILTGGSDYAYQYGHLFIQQPDGTFQDLAQAWGLAFPCMDGLAVADLDRDGDLDVIVRGSLFRNCAAPGWPAISGKDPGFGGYTVPEIHVFTSDASSHGSWLELRLVATDGATNRMGLGATVTVTANGVAQTQQLLGAHGIGSESDDPGVLFFGLGACGGVDSITVRWPNASQSRDTWTNVPAKHLVELHQGDATVYGVNL